MRSTSAHFYFFKKTVASRTDTNHFDFLIRLTCIAIFLTYIISWRLYVPGFRIFELAPLIQTLTLLPDVGNWCLFALSIAALSWLFVFASQKTPAVLVTVCWVFWFLQDINRLQPYNLMYCYTLLIAAFWRLDKHIAINALRLMVSGVYFWAGFHKLNLTFYTSTFPWFISPIYTFSAIAPAPFMDYLFGWITLFTPIFELMIGIFLLFPAMRKIATCMAFIMLITVLICLGPFGHNWAMVVWPWNIWLFLMEYRLFFNQKEMSLPFKRHPIAMLSVIIFMIAPIAAIYYPIYTQPGFKLYSGNTVRGEVIFPFEERLTRVPQKIKAAVRFPHTLSLVDWAIAVEIQNAPYPAPGPMRMSAAGLCPYLDLPAKAILRIYHPAPFYSLQYTIEETFLCL